LDDSAFHIFYLDSARKPLACGRLHFNARDEAQVRFMGVNQNVRGRAHGRRIFEGLEADAARRSSQKIALNAGENETEFYDKHGHAVVDEGQNAFRRDLPCSYGELVVIKPASLWFELLVTPTW
jgi:predicted GNAT family N-acyltransferase